MAELHVYFLPLMGQGHMIPMLHIAKLFASRGVNATIITTPLNAPFFTNAIHKTKHLGLKLSLKIIDFSPLPGLPDGCENTDQVTTPHMFCTFIRSLDSLRQQVEQLLEEYQPNCLVADQFFPWTTQVAAKFHIPRLVFHAMGFFSLCAPEQLRLHNPFKSVLSNSEALDLPNLPHQVKYIRSQIPPHELAPTTNIITECREADERSYGVIVNSFYELEPDYADHYRNVLKRKAWHIGPVSLWSRGMQDKQVVVDEDECLKWLELKAPDSVIFVCFGSMCDFPSLQLHELAMGLENSGQDFIWVVRRQENEEWMPEGFEERVKGKGLMIRGWAPQLLILDHEAVGGFVTHCGSNSFLEGVSAGVPFVTWPCFADQFFTEKLITEILRIGVSVGVKEWSFGGTAGGVKREAIETAIRRLMVGEEAGEMKNRAKALKTMASQAVEEGGSSYLDLDALIKDLTSYCS